MEHLGPALKGLLVALFGHLLALLGHIAGWFREVVEGVLFRLFAQEVSPELGEQARQLGEQVYEASKEWYLSSIAVAIGVVVIFVYLTGYLLISLVTHWRPSLFISYHHSHQTLSGEMEDELRVRQFQPLRIEYREGAAHQEIVATSVVKIRACDLLMSIPGSAQSFVEAEVLSASTLEKPVVFLVSENGGSLPNTASKTYPVFSLERVRDDSFALCWNSAGTSPSTINRPGRSIAARCAYPGFLGSSSHLRSYRWLPWQCNAAFPSTITDTLRLTDTPIWCRPARPARS